MVAFDRLPGSAVVTDDNEVNATGLWMVQGWVDLERGSTRGSGITRSARGVPDPNFGLQRERRMTIWTATSSVPADHHRPGDIVVTESEEGKVKRHRGVNLALWVSEVAKHHSSLRPGCPRQGRETGKHDD